MLVDIPLMTERSTFSNEDESLFINIMMFTLRNEVLSSSWNRFLILPWYLLLNATGISTLPYSKEGFHHCRPGPWRYAGVLSALFHCRCSLYFSSLMATMRPD